MKQTVSKLLRYLADKLNPLPTEPLRRASEATADAERRTRQSQIARPVRGSEQEHPIETAVNEHASDMELRPINTVCKDLHTSIRCCEAETGRPCYCDSPTTASGAHQDTNGAQVGGDSTPARGEETSTNSKIDGTLHLRTTPLHGTIDYVLAPDPHGHASKCQSCENLAFCYGVELVTSSETHPIYHLCYACVDRYGFDKEPDYKSPDPIPPRRKSALNRAVGRRKK